MLCKTALDYTIKYCLMDNQHTYTIGIRLGINSRDHLTMQCANNYDIIN